MRAAPAFVLALLLAASGAAAACSIRGDPPEPAAFVIRDIHSAQAWRIDVEGRMLGNACELGNAFALDGDTFVYAEVRHVDGGWATQAHVHDLAWMERYATWPLGGWVESMGLEGGLLVYHEPGHASSAFYALDVMTGEREPLPFPPHAWGRVALQGALVAAMIDDRLWFYDALARSWLAQDLQVPVATAFYLRAADAQWLAFDGDGGPIVFELATGELHQFPRHRESGIIGLDDGRLYVANNGTLVVQELPVGAERALGPLGGAPLAVSDGRVIEGHYSQPRTRTDGLAAAPTEEGPIVGMHADDAGASRQLPWTQGGFLIALAAALVLRRRT